MRCHPSEKLFSGRKVREHGWEVAQYCFSGVSIVGDTGDGLGESFFVADVETGAESEGDER